MVLSLSAPHLVRIKRHHDNRAVTGTGGNTDTEPLSAHALILTRRRSPVFLLAMGRPYGEAAQKVRQPGRLADCAGRGPTRTRTNRQSSRAGHSPLAPQLGLAFCGPGLAYESPLIYDISR